ncbi:MAG: hypothetical protein QXV17_15195 [Candidatus Micrarchaeaceae archaeon]
MSRRKQYKGRKARKPHMMHLGVVYVDDTLRELSRKLKEFFDEYSIDLAPPSEEHKGKNAYDIHVRGPKKPGYENLFK